MEYQDAKSRWQTLIPPARGQLPVGKSLLAQTKKMDGISAPDYDQRGNTV